MTILCVNRCCLLLLLQPTPSWGFGARLGFQASVHHQWTLVKV